MWTNRRTESELPAAWIRPPAFVSQKIVRAAVQISRGSQKKLALGDLSATVDSGWAQDFVRAMTLIVDLPAPDNFVVTTGQPHSVQQLVQEAFGQLGLDWTKHVEQASTIVARRRGGLVGDSSKLRRLTGWKPSVAFAEMVSRLVEAAILEHRPSTLK